jgi:glycogen(starch) synthase
MKVLHYIYDHIHNPWVGGGGAGRAVELGRRLATRGHEVTIVSGRYPGSADYEAEGVRQLFVGTDTNNYVLSVFCYAARAVGHLRRHAKEVDVIVEDFAPYNPIFSFLRRRDAVLQLHQKEGTHHIRKFGPLGIPFMLIEKFYPRWFSQAVAESEHGRVTFGLEKAHVIPNGFSPDLLAEHPKDHGYILFLGRLDINQKGLDILHAAIKRMPMGADLVIAGGGKDEVKVRELFDDFIGKGTVDMAGYIRGRDKIDRLMECSFMVMPSRYEGQPVTLLEAAACGKPVIVSDIPELSFAVEAGYGLAFKSDDPIDLAEKIQRLWADEPKRREMGRAARQFAQEYSWDAIADKYEKFLLSVS